MTLTAHPLAEVWPIYPDLLEEVRESIREHGLRQPIVLDVDGRIIDGRTRYQACQDLGVEPETTVYEGDDILEYIQDANSNRRHVSTGSRAMIVAQMLVMDGRRKDGKWEYGWAANSAQVPNSFARRVQEAGVILDWTPEVAADVINGDIALKAAHHAAIEKRNDVDKAKQLAAIEANRKREATIRERQANDRMLQVLTDEASPYLTKVETKEMSIAAAHAAHLADTAKEREQQRQLERGWRDANRHITESVRHLNGGHQAATIYLNDVYPHESKHIPHGMHLTKTNIQSAIDFLTTLKKGVTE